MVQGISNKNDNRIYNTMIGCAGIAVGWESEPYLRKCFKFPQKIFIKKQFSNIQGGGYRPYLETAIKQNNLNGKIQVLDLNSNNITQVTNQLVKKPQKRSFISKAISHILRIKSKRENSIKRTAAGQNAFFDPRNNMIVCNFDKFGAPCFHELQHKLNKTSKNPIIRTFAKIRNPLVAFAPLAISATAMLTNKRKPGEKERLVDKIKNNCGLLTTLSFLPLTIEECIANFKGTKIAKKAGVTGDMLKKVKLCHKLSAGSYCMSAIIAGLAAFSANKIRDFICEQKK